MKVLISLQPKIQHNLKMYKIEKKSPATLFDVHKLINIQID